MLNFLLTKLRTLKRSNLKIEFSLSREITGLVFLKLLTILSTFYLTKSLISDYGSNSFGVWVLFQTCLSWSILADLGLSLSFRNRFISAISEQDFDEAKKLVSVLYLGTLLMSSISISISLIILQIVDVVGYDSRHNIDIHFSDLVLFYFSGVLLVSLRSFFSVLLALNKSMCANLIQAIPEWIFLIILSLLSHSYQININQVIKIYMVILIVTYGMANIYFYKKRSADYFSLWMFSWFEFKILIKRGFKYLNMQIAYVVLYSSAPLLINEFYSRQSLAEYGLGSRLFLMIQGLFSTLVIPFWSFFGHSKSERNNKKFFEGLRLLKLLLLFTSILLVFMVLGAKYIFSFISDGSIEVPSSVLIQFAVQVFFFSVLALLSSILNGFGETDTQLRAAIFQVIIYVLFFCIFYYFDVGYISVLYALNFASIFVIVYLVFSTTKLFEAINDWAQ